MKRFTLILVLVLVISLVLFGCTLRAQKQSSTSGLPQTRQPSVGGNASVVNEIANLIVERTSNTTNSSSR